MANENDVPINTGSGANVATITVTRADGTVVHRQEFVMADPDNDNYRVSISQSGEMAVTDTLSEDILKELRRLRVGLSMLLGVPLDNLDDELEQE